MTPETMTHEPTFSAFRADALARGFDEVLVRDWAPGQVLDEHAHPFDASAVVVRGTMWLTVGDETRRLTSGDTFELARGTPHGESYGPEGATYWVARRT